MDDETTTAPRDLQEWITRVEAIGQITRVTEEVDWNEEMGAITYMAHQTLGAPALLFERIRGCPPSFRALWNLIGSNPDRFAITVGEPTGLGVMELIARFKGKLGHGVAPVIVDGTDAPVNAHHRFGRDVDVTIFRPPATGPAMAAATSCPSGERAQARPDRVHGGRG